MKNGRLVALLSFHLGPSDPLHSLLARIRLLPSANRSPRPMQRCSRAVATTPAKERYSSFARNAFPSTHRLSVAPKGQSVLSLPGVATTGLGVVVAVALVETSALLASGGETAHLAVFVDRVDDPVDAWVTADSLVLGVDEDDLVVLVGAVLVDPVAVQHAQVGATAADTLLSGGLKRALVLELVHTLVGGLACSRYEYPLYHPCSRSTHTVGSTLGHWLLAATTAHTHAVDDIALLGLVSKAAGLVGAGWARGAVDDVELAELD